jgi:hypothetical protein
MNINSSARTTGPLRITVIALATACTLAVAACGSPAPRPAPGPAPPGAAARLPGTPAGRQARWLLGAAAHAPIQVAAVKAHFDGTFLAQVPVASLNRVFATVRSLRLDSITQSTPSTLVFVVTANGGSRLTVSMTTDTRGLISGLLLRPGAKPPTVPATWSGVDRMVRSVAPQVRFLVAAVHGNTCQPVRAIDAATPAPLGSAFKLYVLYALARAVATGKVRWDQPLTVTSQVKSLPSGYSRTIPTAPGSACSGWPRA